MSKRSNITKGRNSKYNFFHCRNKKHGLGPLLIFPCLILFLFTVFLPIIATFGYSLKRFKLTEPENEKFIGLNNYIQVLTSSEFYNALINSIFVLVFVMVLGLVLSLMIALVLNKKTRITSFLTAVVIIPWVLPPIVNGIMWKFIFFPGYGLVNKLLINLHLIDTPISWTTNRWYFLMVVSFVIIWRIVPFSAIVILSNLQNIPKDYYSLLSLEGSSKWQDFYHITLPLIVPSLGVVLINLTTTAINVFDEVIALTGYNFQNQTLLVYDYSNTFNFLDFGLGSSISYIIMIIAGFFGYFYVKNMTVEKIY